MIRDRVAGSSSVLVPLGVAFLLFWLGRIDLTGASAKYPAVEPVKPKAKAA